MPHFVTSHRVGFFETDMAGIVHFSNFYRWMEEVEHEFFRSVGLSIISRDEVGRFIGWPRVSAQCSFEHPARYEDLVEIRLDVERIGVKSLTFVIEFFVSGQRIARGRMKTACCLFGDDAPLISIPIPPDYLERLPQVD